MKLASLKSHNRDGVLVVVDNTLQHYAEVPEVAPTMQALLENWNDLAPALEEVYEALNSNLVPGQAFKCDKLASPLPRAYQWLDGSAYLTHVERVRKARGAEMPPSFLDDPLMYQGGSDAFLGPCEAIAVADEGYGIDFEAEVAVVVDDVPQAVPLDEAAAYIRLVMLVNDVSLRNLIPSEIAKGFGFLHGKPPTAFSPVAVTLDELGGVWRDNKLHLPLRTHLNGKLFGCPNAGADMQFDFARLIHHAAKTRPLAAGTIIGSGTVSNADLTKGCSCLAERRVLEVIESGAAQTPFMSYGDSVEIEMLDGDGDTIFGKICQQVVPWNG